MKILASDPITSWQIDAETVETMTDFFFLGSKITADGDCSCELKDASFLEEKLWQSYYFPDKGPSSQSYGFSSSHVWIWELDHKEGWAPKDWYPWNVVLEKTSDSPLDSKEIQLVKPKGNQLWIFVGRTDAEAEAPILWPPDVKSRLIGKDPDAEKDWGQEGKGPTEDKMVGWHHWLNGHGFE